MNYVGIDVSKDTFHADFGAGKAQVFGNDEEGVGIFLGRLAAAGLVPGETVVGMEATGVYHLLVADRAAAAGWQARIINPLLVSRLGRASLRHAKTDAKDAALVRSAAARGLGYAPCGREAMRLRGIVQQRASLVAMRAKVRQLTHVRSVRGASLGGDAGPDCYGAVEDAISAQISSLDRAALKVDAKTQELLRSIPGVGPACSAALAAKVGDVANFPSPEKLAAFIGLDCRVHESGTSVKGKGYITKRGDGTLRHLLFLAANVSRRYVPELGAFYDKKKGEGKHHFVALCAVERKLVHLIWAVWTRGTPFYQKTTSAE
jgi:transposase